MRIADTYLSATFQVVQSKLCHLFPCVQSLAKITPFLHQIYGTHFQSTRAERPVEAVYICFHSSQIVFSHCQLNMKQFLCGFAE